MHLRAFRFQKFPWGDTENLYGRGQPPPGSPQYSLRLYAPEHKRPSVGTSMR